MKKAIPFKFYFIIFLISTAINVHSQNFDSVLLKLSQQYPQEKLHLHFDRTVYAPGENIWFKAYLFNGNFLSTISKTLYAELIDGRGKVIERKTIPLTLSSGASSFTIPENSAGTVLYVRAYTKWMLNFDSSYLYTKAIPILNLNSIVNKPIPLPQKNIATEVKAQTATVQFFPEGGDLIAGVESRIAFKAINGTGRPVNVKGEIFDNRKNKIMSFEVIHDGMGSFILKPKTGETYKALWHDETGIIREAELPLAKPNGVVLQVDNNFNQIEFKIKRVADAPFPYPFVYVVAQMNQHLIYRAKANLTHTVVASGVIPIESLPAGIVQVTLFTPDEKPLAERITFINSASSSFITDLNTAIKGLDKRKKNVLQIDVPDTIVTNLSISVTDAELSPSREEDDIFSRILLTSDIKGYVHNPSYYFSGDADSITAHLDLVMMTNGWRRFKWENVLAGKYPKLNYLPENYLNIEGRVYGVNKNQLATKQINLIIQAKNGNKQFVNLPLQAEGKFNLPDVVFFDTAKFYYQINNDKGKSLTERASFEIKSSFLKDAMHQLPDHSLLSGITKADTIPTVKNREIYQELLSQEDLKKLKTLKEVVITTRRKSKEQILDEEYTSGFFSGGDARTFSPDDDPFFSVSQNVFQYLQGRVAGLQISTSGGETSVSWRGSKTSLFLNEIEQEPIVIEDIPMSDVAMIKVFHPPFFGAFLGGAGGAIAVYLKKGVNGTMTKGLDFVSVAGYSPVKEFYSPDYSKPAESFDNDYRKTLYWNPFIITDKNNHRIFVTFYNNDITRKMKVIIEGCNEDGVLTRVEKVIQ